MPCRTHHFALLLLHAFVGIVVNGTPTASPFQEDGGSQSDFLSEDGEVGDINYGGNDLTDISPADIPTGAIGFNLAEADLHTLTYDLNVALTGSVDTLEENIFSSIDVFQEQVENATERMAFNLQCIFTRRIEESVEIMNKIFLLSPSDIELIKSQLEGNVSIEPIDFESATTTFLTPTTIQPEKYPKNCAEALAMELPTGVTTIKVIADEDPQRVWCDQDTDGGGWMVMLRRELQPIQEDFRQNWDAYVEGFGDPGSEYWIGLETLHQLTKRQPYRLRVQMGTDSDGQEAFSIYNIFRVAAGWRDYKLRVGDYNESSTGGDALEYHNGQKFTTYDEDNDGASGGNCAEWSGGGGWWYDYCYFSNPTAVYPYVNDSSETDMYVEWRKWRGYYVYLSHFDMMIKPRS